jgi:hypothetical protein
MRVARYRRTEGLNDHPGAGIPTFESWGRRRALPKSPRTLKCPLKSKARYFNTSVAEELLKPRHADFDSAHEQRLGRRGFALPERVYFQLPSSLALASVCKRPTFKTRTKWRSTELWRKRGRERPNSALALHPQYRARSPEPRNCGGIFPAHIRWRIVRDGVAGGGSGIRTHVTVSRKHAFQACAFSHSATPPRDRRDTALPAD